MQRKTVKVVASVAMGRCLHEWWAKKEKSEQGRESDYDGVGRTGGRRKMAGELR
jgi:hypothetical protein